MELNQFLELKERYKKADTDGKIAIYANAAGLSQTQYRELLTLFPLNEIDKLEAAL